VKLVATSGGGTIATGVAKGYADNVQISGADGGTGAPPLSSIKNAGLPWEVGLSETQQALVASGLRDRVSLRVDGGLKTGHDVVVAALMGAEAFGFGTVALVAAGCAMIRQCHLNTCPVGIATQDPELRKKFAGEPEHVVRFFLYLAQQVRMLLADIGVRSVAELVGRSDLLQPRSDPAALDLPRGVRLDLQALLDEARGAVPTGDDASLPARSSVQERNDRPGRSGGTLDDRLAEDAAVLLAGEGSRGPLHLAYDVTNRERSLGSRLAGDIARSVGDAGLPDGALRVELSGAVGQSFGAFNLPGMHLSLTGEAQDYVGKSMAGGELVLRHRLADGSVKGHVIAGNTLLYGATGGALFAAGSVGERVCVRNSGAIAVVEGCGDHGCEYMTGGTVVVLGRTGRNFAAGMSGGVAYVLDVDGTFERRLNSATVTATRMGAGVTRAGASAGSDVAAAGAEVGEDDGAELKRLLERHVALTGSPRASELLADWTSAKSRFWRVAPSADPVALPDVVDGEGAELDGSQPYAATVPSSAAT